MSTHRLGTCDLQGSCLSRDLHLKLLARKRPYSRTCDSPRIKEERGVGAASTCTKGFGEPPVNDKKARGIQNRDKV